MAGGGPEDYSALDWITWAIKTPFDIHSQTFQVGNWGISRALYLVSVFFGLFFILAHLIPNLPLFAFQWLIGTAPVWLPVALWVSGWHAWVWYIQSLFISGRNPVLLEMKIPREISQSPRAMEIALASLWISSGETTFIHRGWFGQVRPYFSLEIASFGGDVRFYIWCWKNYAHTVQETMYAMYPEIELIQVEDYASRFQFDKDVHNVFGAEWRLESSRDRSSDGYGKGKEFRVTDFYPIKSYIDFELDEDPKEEHRVDPLAGVVEFLSAMHPYEQLWVQLIIRRCGKYGVLMTRERDDEWKKGVEKEVEFIRAQSNALPGVDVDIDQLGVVDEDKRQQRFPNPSPRHKAMMESLDRHMSKLPFEFVGRGIYISTRPLHGPTYTHMRWLWKAMGNSAYGSHLRPRRWHCDFDYPWQDVHNIRFKNQSRRVLDAFRRRSAFHSPWKLPADVLTNESLATIWRPPSSSLKSPGLERIPAKKAEAPLNLPR